jgi:hypothetical protein
VLIRAAILCIKLNDNSQWTCGQLSMMVSISPRQSQLKDPEMQGVTNIAPCSVFGMITSAIQDGKSMFVMRYRDVRLG